jgi:peptide/nickel transport system permease protein
MKPYILRRLALAVPTLALVSMIVFSMMRLMPGDVVSRMVEGHAYAPTIEALRKELGLDRPAHVQYAEWIGGILLRGDFGDSYWTRQPSSTSSSSASLSRSSWRRSPSSCPW